MKKLFALLLAALLMFCLFGCGKKVALTCDGCGKTVYGDPKMDDSWIIFCEDCEPELDFD